MVARLYRDHRSTLADLYPRHGSKEDRRRRLRDFGSVGKIFSPRKQVLSVTVPLTVLQACALTQSILAIFQVHAGFGRNIQYLRPKQIEDFARLSFFAILLNIVGTSFVRISVCLFILQLLPITEKISRL